MKRCSHAVYLIGPTDAAGFQRFFDLAWAFATASKANDMWAEAQPGYAGFHFQSHDAYLKFAVAAGERGHKVKLRPPTAIKVTPSLALQTCRTLVRDDAFEVRLSLYAVGPLLGDALRHIQSADVRAFSVYLRRALTRYLALGMCRLLERPQNGRTGVTASIESLIEMLEAENIPSSSDLTEQKKRLDAEKKKSAEGQYDLVKALRDLRNIQVAHTLIPYVDPTDQIWSHHLIEFAEGLVQFVIDLDELIEDATGESLADLREPAHNFEAHAFKVWELMKSAK